MKGKVNLRHAVAMHLRAIRELHRVSPKFFPVLTLYCIFGAITPYVTVFFSAKILSELATLRRAEILWQWVIASVFCVGITAIVKAIVFRRKRESHRISDRQEKLLHREKIRNPEAPCDPPNRFHRQA